MLPQACFAAACKRHYEAGGTLLDTRPMDMPPLRGRRQMAVCCRDSCVMLDRLPQHAWVPLLTGVGFVVVPQHYTLRHICTWGSLCSTKLHKRTHRKPLDSRVRVADSCCGSSSQVSSTHHFATTIANGSLDAAYSITYGYTLWTACTENTCCEA